MMPRKLGARSVWGGIVIECHVHALAGLADGKRERLADGAVTTWGTGGLALGVELDRFNAGNVASTCDGKDGTACAFAQGAALHGNRPRHVVVVDQGGGDRAGFDGSGAGSAETDVESFETFHQEVVANAHIDTLGGLSWCKGQACASAV